MASETIYPIGWTLPISCRGQYPPERHLYSTNRRSLYRESNPNPSVYIRGNHLAYMAIHGIKLCHTYTMCTCSMYYVTRTANVPGPSSMPQILISELFPYCTSPLWCMHCGVRYCLYAWLIIMICNNWLILQCKLTNIWSTLSQYIFMRLYYCRTCRKKIHVSSFFINHSQSSISDYNHNYDFRKYHYISSLPNIIWNPVIHCMQSQIFLIDLLILLVTWIYTMFIARKHF